MNKEILIADFLHRLETEVIESFVYCSDCGEKTRVEMDKEAARRALDRLFKNLKDFTELKKNRKGKTK